MSAETSWVRGRGLFTSPHPTVNLTVPIFHLGVFRLLFVKLDGACSATSTSARAECTACRPSRSRTCCRPSSCVVFCPSLKQRQSPADVLDDIIVRTAVASFSK